MQFIIFQKAFTVTYHHLLTFQFVTFARFYTALSFILFSLLFVAIIRAALFTSAIQSPYTLIHTFAIIGASLSFILILFSLYLLVSHMGRLIYAVLRQKTLKLGKKGSR